MMFTDAVKYIITEYDRITKSKENAAASLKQVESYLQKMMQTDHSIPESFHTEIIEDLHEIKKILKLLIEGIKILGSADPRSKMMILKAFPES
ncbi:MAG: hypothetical protein HQK77_18425 [Desulfobacterales bacterium]|nr:hypothetical protein [Desulfobacterales bacterium]